MSDQSSLIKILKSSIRGPGKRLYGSKLVVRNPLDIVVLSKVLSSESRLVILNYLSKHGPTSISELAEKTGFTIANISVQVKILEQAGLVKVDLKSGKRGLKRVVSLKVDRIYLIL